MTKKELNTLVTIEIKHISAIESYILNEFLKDFLIYKDNYEAYKLFSRGHTLWMKEMLYIMKKMCPISFLYYNIINENTFITTSHTPLNLVKDYILKMNVYYD